MIKGIFELNKNLKLSNPDPFTIHDTIYETITGHMVVF